MKEYTANYMKAGGQASFSDYYTAKYGNAIMKPSLKENIVWASHNLVMDASFNEFQVISCRNVMIYFDKALQGRVHKLFYESLVVFGFLGLGKSESIAYTPYEKYYEALGKKDKIFRKVK
jgi:chemotaxis protein methyltransferase CheR